MINGTSLANCSLGFTATATNGTRWYYTAGHCLTPEEVANRVIQGHGTEPIGYARADAEGGALDVGWVRNNSNYCLSAGGGYIYKLPTETVNVNYAITSASTIQQDQIACYSGKNLAPTDDNCGVISAPNMNGRPQVTGLKICRGDSGGSVYTLQNGQRWAYGLVSVISISGTESCVTNGQMSFSAVPYINTWIDSITADTVRIDVRS